MRAGEISRIVTACLQRSYNAIQDDWIAARAPTCDILYSSIHNRPYVWNALHHYGHPLTTESIHGDNPTPTLLQRWGSHASNVLYARLRGGGVNPLMAERLLRAASIAFGKLRPHDAQVPMLGISGAGIFLVQNVFYFYL